MYNYIFLSDAEYDVKIKSVSSCGKCVLDIYPHSFKKKNFRNKIYITQSHVKFLEDKLANVRSI